MNTPRIPINPDDPKWTAYVLGELDEAERAEIERLLETSEEARALVEELTIATAVMKEELSSSMPLMMSAEQRAAIRTAAEPAPRRWFEVFPAKWGLSFAVAAMVILAVAMPLTWNNSQQVLPRAEAPAPLDAQKVNSPEEAATQPLLDKEATLSSEAREQTAAATARKQERDAAAPVVPGGVVAAPVTTPDKLAEARQDGAPAPNQNSPAAVALGRGVLDANRFSTPGAVNSINLTRDELATAPPSAPASGRGALAGIVTDASGALLPGVTVTARNGGTGVATTAVTNESGAYNFATLQSGTYQVSAFLPGFQTQTVSNLELTDSARRQNYQLQVGTTATQVEVGPDRTAVLTESAAVGDVLPQARLLAAPPPPAPVPPPPPPAQLQKAAQPAQQAPQGAGGRGGGGGRGAGAPAGVSAGVFGGTLGAIVTRETRDGLSVNDSRVAAPPPPPPAAAVRADAFNKMNVANTEAYDRVVDNPFIRTTQEPLATFSIDVDTASYANVRRFLNQNQLPPPDAVRIEELVNYFSYDYAQPAGNAPIAPNMEVAAAPWNPSNRLVRIGIKAREVNANRRPPSNLVFLIDVSGSMNSPEKLPLVKAGLGMLVERLSENDMVSMVVYAGNSGLVLPPTSGIRKEDIRQAIDRLQAGGSTNGGSGIQLAYNQATANFLRNGVNRVILMTDGDFNVGITNQGDLTRLIEERARSGVFLSVLGFGMGNIKDSTLEKLADQGNGHYAYIDNLTEARKVLVEEMSGTLVTVAKDVKIQVDFNPARVEAYRLIGYENRVLRTEDFNNDAKDAGDMGAGHTVTALFEVVPKGGQIPGPSIDASKYTQPTAATAVGGNAGTVGATSNEMLNLRIRYKLPDSDTSTRMDVPLVDRGQTFARASSDFRFAAAVAEFGMILRDSPYRGSARMESVLDIAEQSRGVDRNGYRTEFISLVQKARNLGR